MANIFVAFINFINKHFNVISLIQNNLYNKDKSYVHENYFTYIKIIFNINIKYSKYKHFKL